MLEIEDDKFVTQYIYRCREEKREFTLGYVAQFKDQGEAKRYKKSDPNYMYRDFWHDFKASVDGVNWTDGWDTQSGAVRKLLEHHNKDLIWGFYHIIPCPETFKKNWKELDYTIPYKHKKRKKRKK